MLGERWAALAGLLGLVVVIVAVQAGAGSGVTLARSGSAGGNRLGWGSVPVAARGPVAAGLGAVDPAYRVRGMARGLAAISPGQGWHARFGAGGVTVGSGGLSFGLRLSAMGYGRSLWRVAAVAPEARGNRVSYGRAQVTEWYANGPLGLEQGFVVVRPPAGATGPLTLSMALSGDLRASLAGSGRALTLERAGHPVLAYGDLAAFDARGQTMRSWLELHNGRLEIRVDTRRAAYPVRIDPFIQKAELTASDGATPDELGTSVAVSADGSTVVAGAPLAKVGGNAQQGAAYVFVRPAGGWSSGTEIAKLTASDGAANDEFGNAVGVSADGSTVVAGALLADPGGIDRGGAAYVFVRPAGGWATTTENAKLTASDVAPGQDFGFAVGVSADGSTVFAVDGHATGGIAAQPVVYVFVRPPAGWSSRTETARLTASDGASGSLAVLALSADGSTIVLSAPYTPVGGNLYQGALYMFVKPAGGWATATETAKLTASDGTTFDTLGSSVAISGDGSTVLAGAPEAAVGSHVVQGAVYVFTRPAVGWSSGTQTAKLTASDGAAGDHLGGSVAVSADGSTVFASAQPATYVFVKPALGWLSGTQTAKLAGIGLGGVSADGATLVAGAPQATVGTNVVQGAVYVFGVAAMPQVQIFSPGSGGTYAAGQQVTTSFSCSEGTGGPGLASCDDDNGTTTTNGGSGHLDTDTVGAHTYTVSATSQDSLTASASITYTVAGAPLAQIALPASGGAYAVGQPVTTSYACSEGASGPGLASCTDSNGGSGGSGHLDTSTIGSHTYVVTATSLDGQTATTSIGYTVVAAPVNVSPPTLAGTAQQGGTLIETHGAWTNSPASYGYQWRRCDSAGGQCATISGAVDQTYTLTLADVGSRIRVQEWATNAGGTGGPATSGVTGVVTPVAPPTIPPRAGPSPTIAGTAKAGDTLSVTTGTWSGTPPLSFSYQWQRCDPACVNIAGATGSSYTAGNDDVGASMQALVTASNAAGSAQAASAQRGPIAPSDARVRSLVSKQLAPWGKPSKIGVLLRNGGYTASFKALSGGSLAIEWYYLPKGADLNKPKHKPTPILIAAGSARFFGAKQVKLAIRLTVAGKRMLNSASTLRLTGRGIYTPTGNLAITTIRTFTLKR